MATPQHSIIFWAPPVNAEPTLLVGDVVIPDDDGSGDWVIASAANRGTRGSEGVALSVTGGSGFGAVEIQSAGILDATTSGLAAGAKQLVRVSTAGRIERIASYTAGDDVIGHAEADGRVHLHFGLPWGEILALAGGISPAGDPGDAQYNLDDTDLTASQQGLPPEFYGVLSTGTAAANNAALLTTGAAFGGARGDFALTLPTKTFSTEGFSRSLTPGTERWPYGLSVMGKGPTSVFQLATDGVDSNHLFLFEDTTSERERETHLAHFTVKGTASGAYGAGGGSDQNAIEIGYLAADGGSRFLILGVTGYRLKGRLVSVAAADGLSFGPRIIGTLAEDCLYGYYIAHPGELLGAQAIDCNTGVRINGNVSDIGGTLQGCATGYSIIGGGNDAHSLILGKRFVHNTIVMTVGAIVNGMLISDCLVYEGAVNFATGNTGAVSVNGGQWDATTYELLGKSVWRGVDFDTGYSGVITIGAGSQNEFMRDCRDMTGNVPAMIGEYIDNTFSFAANANETLTAQKSVAQYLIISDGAALTARQITSTLLPRKGTRREFYNSGSYDHTFKFSTGTAITLKAGQRTVVGADGTNATIQSNPLIAGSNITLTPSAAGITVAASGSSGAPADATYVTLSTNGTLTNERVLTAGTGISLTDGGAGGNITVANTLPYNGITGSDQHMMFFDGANNPAGDGGCTFNKTTDVLSVASGIGIGGGTIYSATAKLRFAYAATDTIIGVKDSGGTDRILFNRSAADTYVMGAGGTTFVGWQDWYQLNLWGRGGGLFVYAGSGGTTILSSTGTDVRLGKPMCGMTANSAPWGSDGDVNIVMASANKTLSAAEYAMKVWRFTGTLGANRTVTVQSVAAGEGYTKEVWVDIASDFGVTLSTGSGKTALIKGTGTGANINRATISVTDQGVVVHGCVTNDQITALGN